MIELRLNNQIADIDDKTIIGFELQTYDITEPGKPKIVISNNFTIPLTANNRKIVGFAGNSQVDTDAVYLKIDVKYIIGNDILIENARARVENISERIELFIYQKEEFWDTLKKTKITDILSDMLDYLILKYSYPSITSKDADLGTFVSKFNTNTTGLKIPFYFSNLSAYRVSEAEPFFEAPNYITLADGTKQGGHFSLYIKDIFEFIESHFNIDFQTGETFDGNIFQDSFFLKMHTPFQNIAVRNDSGYYLDIQSSTDLYSPLDDIAIKADKSLFDLLSVVFKHLNILIEPLFLDGSYVYRLYRFDDISTKAPVVDWSGNMSEKISFKPAVNGYAQNTYIKFSSVFEGGDPFLNSKKIVVANENIDAEKTLIEIDSFICGFTKSLADNLIPVLNTSEPFNGFTILIDTEESESVEVYYNDQSTTVQLDIPGLYSLNDEYNVLASIMNKPKIYEVEKWLTLSDIRILRYFCLYFFKELGGSFFINKISGFNPANNNTPTKLELIKVSNKTPQSTVDGNYWTDGKANRFTDGKGNYFIW